MKPKRAFLMATAQRFEMESLTGCYDDREQLNVITSKLGRTPLVLEEAFVRTQSKTAQAPGDDDPDPEDEGCY